MLSSETSPCLHIIPYHSGHNQGCCKICSRYLLLSGCLCIVCISGPLHDSKFLGPLSVGHLQTLNIQIIRTCYRLRLLDYTLDISIPWPTTFIDTVPVDIRSVILFIKSLLSMATLRIPRFPGSCFTFVKLFILGKPASSTLFVGYHCLIKEKKNLTYISNK